MELYWKSHLLMIRKLIKLKLDLCQDGEDLTFLRFNRFLLKKRKLLHFKQEKNLLEKLSITCQTSHKTHYQIWTNYLKNITLITWFKHLLRSFLLERTLKFQLNKRNNRLLNHHSYSALKDNLKIQPNLKLLMKSSPLSNNHQF